MAFSLGQTAFVPQVSQPPGDRGRAGGRPALSPLAGFRRTETGNRPCDPAARIRVENDAGLIEIRSWERMELELIAEKHGPDEASLDRLAVEVTETPEGILVTCPAEPGPDSWVDFIIRCPRMAALDLHNVSGEVLLSGFHGQSRVATASGAIRAARMRGTSTLTSASGSIDGAALEGTVYARTASGRVSLHGQLTGSHRVETASGDIIVDGVQGSIDARSASGAIAVEGRLTGPRAPSARAPATAPPPGRRRCHCSGSSRTPG